MLSEYAPKFVNLQYRQNVQYLQNLHVITVITGIAEVKCIGVENAKINVI